MKIVKSCIKVVENTFKVKEGGVDGLDAEVVEHVFEDDEDSEGENGTCFCVTVSSGPCFRFSKVRLHMRIFCLNTSGCLSYL